MTVVALAGAALVERRLLTTFMHIARFYLDPSDWSSYEARGPHCRYEMQHVFAHDPEYVDALIFELVCTSDSYSDFLRSLANEDLPAPRDVLDRRLWGLIFPTVRTLATQVVPNEVVENHGPYASGLDAEDVFLELRGLALSDKTAFMDRWQYYWCLRNLNTIDAILRRTLSWSTQLLVVLAGGALYAAGWAIGGSPHHAQISVALGTFAAGAILWLLVICGGASVFMIAAFRGTGTFSIEMPCVGQVFDPLWNDVVRVGIVAFAASFLVFGIGGPFLLDPRTLSQFDLDTRFLLYSGASFAFCGLVFTGHIASVHELMADSRRNALSRIGEAIQRETVAERRSELVQHFRDVRGLRTWPIRSVTLAQLAAGIVLPVAVQSIVLYLGLQGG